MSAVYRAPIFFLTSLRAGWRLALSAMFAETAFRVIVSGFYRAATQALRKLEPAWLAVAIILLLIPAAVQLLEYAVHRMHGTPNLAAGVILSGAIGYCLFVQLVCDAPWNHAYRQGCAAFWG